MEPKFESEWYPSPCITHSKKRSHIGECLLYEALGENVSSLLCRWEILQGYHLIMHQDLDVVTVSQFVWSSVSVLDQWKS